MILMKLMRLMTLAQTEKNRIMAFLLALLMTVTLVPTSAFAEEVDESGEEASVLCEVCSTEPCICEDEGEGEVSALCEVCGSDPCTCEADGEELPAEPTTCEVCGADPCTCENTGESEGSSESDESGEETLPDYSADIGMNAVFNPDGYEYLMVLDEEPDEDWDTKSMSFGVAEFSEDILFGIDAYKIVTKIYYTYDENGDIIDTIDTEIEESLWYQVRVLGGTVPEDFESGFWILQNHLGDYADEVDSLILSRPDICDICGEYNCTTEHVQCPACGTYDCPIQHVLCPICGEYDCEIEHVLCDHCGNYDCKLNHGYCELCDKEDCGILHILCGICGNYDCTVEHVQCPICGEYDCTIQHIRCDICGEYDCTVQHVQCPICGEYDCTLLHAYCGVCGAMDCTADHVYCPVCEDFDCGLEHEPEPEKEPYVPPTEPVIPEDPQLPDEYEVAILDGNGNLITEETGFLLNWTDKASLSAWSSLGENVYYQWQILCDAEEDLWVNISGKTDKGLLFSRAMLMSVLDEDNCAWLRCVTKTANEELIGEPVCVTLLAPDAADAENPEEGTSVMAAETPGLFARMVSFAASLFSLRAADDPNYVTITINYWTADSLGSDNKTQQFSPYVATIVKGDPFKQNVVSPPYLGYAAFYDHDGNGVIDKNDPAQKATTFSLDIASVTEDKVYDLYFLPIEVPFAIRYFFQNINDDDYTEKTGLYYTGMLETGTFVNDEFLQNCLELKNGGPLPGYTKMHHEPEAVAADGSTVFECYYDREYYMIAFSIGQDAYGVEPIYARYETPVLVSTPVRPGHTFSGWDQMPYNKDTDKFDAGDGIKDPLPTTLPAENQKYSALWTPAQANYTVVYWLQETTGNSYLGQSVGTGTTGQLATLDIFKCGKLAHTHDASCSEGCPLEEHNHATAGCTKAATPSCGLTEHSHDALCKSLDCNHTHTEISCYTESTTYQLVTDLSNSQSSKKAFNNSLDDITPEAGHLYKVNYYNSYYNFFYINNTWYYLGKGQTAYLDIEPSTTLANPYNGYYNHVAATINCNHAHTDGCYTITCTTPEHSHNDNCYAWTCGKAEHAHGDSCSTCGLTEHEHTDCDVADLPFDPYRKEYVTHDTDVVIAGDGSSILNVYYKYKDYTLRFYYARSSTTGTNFQVVGGTSWYFGSHHTSNNANSTVAELLSRVTEWGTVSGLSGSSSDFNAKGQDRIASNDYRVAYDTFNNYRYYYVEFTAPFNSNLKNLWPVDIFNSVTSAVHTHNGVQCDGKAYFSAWNGEFKVKYTQDNSSRLGTGLRNETIKGLYLYLDENLLFDPKFGIDGDLISFLCFWENGADVSWSFPELYEYKLWVNPASGFVGTKTYGSDKTADYYTNTHAQYQTAFDTYQLYDEFSVYDDSSPSAQTPTSIRGYAAPIRVDKALDTNGADGSMEHYVVNFFYDCGGFELNLQNKDTEIHVSDDVAFGTLLKDVLSAALGNANCEPPYPTGTLEAGGYEFEGWYTSEDFSAFSRIDLETATMTDHNLKLFARWVPKTHKVTFFFNLNDLNKHLNGQTVVTHQERFVKHNWTVGNSDPEHPLENPPFDNDDTTDDNYMDFVRWFYLDNGKKVAFSVDETLIKKDLNVYAEWRDKRIQSFKISYKLLKDKTTPVADDHTGYAYLSTTRTFTAKSGNPDNQLYAPYSSGYFPTVASHSILMEFEPDLDNPVHNVYDFYYTKATNVQYRVRYVNSATGVIMDETAPITTTDNVVTVAFKPFEGFTPDAFYKRLVLSVKETTPGSGVYVGNDEANVITFYYTPNTLQAYYAVHYMEEILGKPGQYEESHWDQGLGQIGETVPVTPSPLPGFKLAPEAAEYTVGSSDDATTAPFDGSSFNIPITADGTALYVYYDRLEYNYVVHYYEYNTTTPLIPSIYGVAEYEDTVTETAPSIANWTCVSKPEQTITIREEDKPAGELANPITDVKQNKIVFYYLPKQYTVDYIAVPTAGGKIFPSTRETISGDQPLAGVTLTENPYYEFEGWYTDEACTQEVTIDHYDVYDKATGAFTPKKSALSDVGVNTFYAKFRQLAADFTITRNYGLPGQVFIYRIVGNGLSIDVPICVNGNGYGRATIADLPFGDYTVTQLNSWSWRYRSEAESGSVKITHNADSLVDDSRTVDFNGQLNFSQWLTGISNFIRILFGGS